MKIKEVTIKELVDTTFKNWGYANKKSIFGKHIIDGPYIATILNTLYPNQKSNRYETGNVATERVLFVYTPFITSRNKKLICIIKLTDKEERKLFKSGFFDSNKSKVSHEELCKIALSLYNGKKEKKIIK